MVELALGHVDLARVRFAHSPIRELVSSLLVLQDPSRQPMYGRWLATVRPSSPICGWSCWSRWRRPGGSFLPSCYPPPDPGPPSPMSWPPSRQPRRPFVRSELDLVREERPLPVALRALYQDPPAQLPSVVEELERY